MNRYIEIIQATINDIEENLTSDITVSGIAKNSGISVWQFQRIFRSMVGDSLGNYIRHRRLTMAAQRLMNTEQRIIDISFDFGFNSQEAFSRAFKTYFAITPNQMRKKTHPLNTKKKPIITPSLLSHLNGGIDLIPKIITTPEILIVGMETKVQNVYADYQDFNKTLVPLWNNFLEEAIHINERLDFAIGLIKYDEFLLDEEEQSYIAAVAVSGFSNIPKNMITLKIPAQTYAVFTNTGLGDKSSLTMNYIYGTWLPQSQYRRSKTDDFERFDNRYSLGVQSSVSEYYLPITKAKKK